MTPTQLVSLEFELVSAVLFLSLSIHEVLLWGTSFPGKCKMNGLNKAQEASYNITKLPAKLSMDLFE